MYLNDPKDSKNWKKKYGKSHRIKGTLASVKLCKSNFYSHPISFGQKYGHFSFFCKQIESFQEQVYIFRKVTSAPTFLA